MVDVAEYRDYLNLMTTTNKTKTFPTYVSRVILARAKAFSGAPVQEHRFEVDAEGTVRVWDSTAGHYTLCHALSESAKQRIRRLAHA